MLVVLEWFEDKKDKLVVEMETWSVFYPQAGS
jgi:hypothetical protein